MLRRGFILGLFGFICLATNSALAEDIIRLNEEISDREFYRAVACFAEPKGKCRRPIVRWEKSRARDLRVALARTEAGFPKQEVEWANEALDDAIEEINAAGADVKLRRVAPRAKADINVYLLNVPVNAKLKNTRIREMDGRFLEQALVSFWYQNRSRHIYRAVIIMAPGETTLHGYRSIMLEELVQSLGFSVDIEGFAYEFGSIFSQTRNARRDLGKQDKAALRQHYPLSR